MINELLWADLDGQAITLDDQWIIMDERWVGFIRLSESNIILKSMFIPDKGGPYTVMACGKVRTTTRMGYLSDEASQSSNRCCQG